MKIENNYEELYAHWSKEFSQTEISALPQDLFENYKEIYNYFQNLSIEEKDPLKGDILREYRENFLFLFEDLLKMRELKILNHALALKQIVMDHLFDAEQIFYRQLVNAIKGFEKVKRISALQGIDMSAQYESAEEAISEALEVSSEDALALESKKNKKEGVGQDFEKKVTNKIQTRKKEEVEEAEEVEEKEKEPEREPLKDKKKKKKKAKKESKLEYNLIRFLKNTPALVGVDLINYGPFHKEDIAFLPKINAEILLIEKFAEKIELS